MLPAGRGALRTQQPVIFHPGGAAGRADVAGGVHRIGVGGVYAQVGSLHKGAAISSGVNRPQCTVMPAKLPCSSLPSGGGHAHQNVRPKLGQLPGKNAALGGAR